MIHHGSSPQQARGNPYSRSIFEEAGVHTPLKEGILDALGGPTTVREVAFVSEEDR